MAENKKALIIFSRLPIGRETKTRLAPLLNEKEREKLHLLMWEKIFGEVLKLPDSIDIFLYWTGSGDIQDYRKFIPSSFHLKEQKGINLGERMNNAMEEIFNSGYESAAIIGSDIPSLKKHNITNAFDILKKFDIVLGASGDGGYWLIGMNKFIPEAFTIKSWGNSSVLQSTIEKIECLGFTYCFTDTLNDIDTPEDIKCANIQWSSTSFSDARSPIFSADI